MTPDTFLIRQQRAASFVYNIDIVGTCNLGCPSCPVGNTPLGAVSRGAKPRGFMPFELFSRILDKIRREAPVPRPLITLYNWGEPLLHPDLGRIIALVRAQGLFCGVSTNLNLVKPSEWARVAALEELDTSCAMRDQEMALNCDGSVALCCSVYDYANNVAPDFLAVSHDELQARKNRHELCGPCMKAGYPRSAGLDSHPEILKIVASRASAR